MVGQRQPKPSTDAADLRKIRKPLVEKKRRDRINNSLAQLQTMLTQNSKHNGPAVPKLDKADILEMTVRHLKQLQQQQQTIQTTRYSRGFKDCTRETMRYLRVSQALDDKRLYSLNNHLFNAYMTKTQDETNQAPSNNSIQEVKPQTDVVDTTVPFVSSSPCAAPKIEYNRDLARFRGLDKAVSVGPIVHDETVWRPW